MIHSDDEQKIESAIIISKTVDDCINILKQEENKLHLGEWTEYIKDLIGTLIDASGDIYGLLNPNDEELENE